MDNSEALNIEDDATVQLIGHMMDNLINEDVTQASRNGFIVIFFKPKPEGGTDIKHVSNLPKNQARNGLASTLAGWG